MGRPYRMRGTDRPTLIWNLCQVRRTVWRWKEHLSISFVECPSRNGKFMMAKALISLKRGWNFRHIEISPYQFELLAQKMTEVVASPEFQALKTDYQARKFQEAVK